MPELRVLDTIKRPMQRLGYLKRLIKRVTALSSSNLENLGADLVDTVSRKVRVTLDQARVTYIKTRLSDKAYSGLKQQAEDWAQRSEGEGQPVMMELQDLYLADPALPSQVGKLVHNDRRKYPPLGTILGFVRAGTYSPNTRALSLLTLIPDAELQGFLEYSSENNPLRISPAQSLLFLYAFLENDGEVVAPLWNRLMLDLPNGFSDREAGDRLPDIYRTVIGRHRKSSLAIDARKRLEVLEKSAESIARASAEPTYRGGSSREEASRPRIEPFVDMGLIIKSDPARYENYQFSETGHVWAEALNGLETSDAIVDFLANRFFSTAARTVDAEVRELKGTAEIVPYLHEAWSKIQSPGGYAPIEELAVLGGISALLRDKCVFDAAPARQALLEYQKQQPYDVRFTVNRLGVLAHTRFLQPFVPPKMTQP